MTCSSIANQLFKCRGAVDECVYPPRRLSSDPACVLQRWSPRVVVHLLFLLLLFIIANLVRLETSSSCLVMANVAPTASRTFKSPRVTALLVCVVFIVLTSVDASIPPFEEEILIWLRLYYIYFFLPPDSPVFILLLLLRSSRQRECRTSFDSGGR